MGCGTLVGLALAAAGAGASEVGAHDSLNAENKAEENQLNEQAQYAKKGSALFSQSLATSTPLTAQQQIGQGQAQALNAAKVAQSVPLGLGLSVDPSVNQQQQARTGLANQANTAFQGYSNYPLQQSLNNQQINNQLAANSASSQSAASAMPAIMQQASQSGSSLQGIGSLLSAAGLLTGLGSSAGLFGSASAGAVPSSAFLNIAGQPITTGAMSAGQPFFDPLLGNWSFVN